MLQFICILNLRIIINNNKDFTLKVGNNFTNLKLRHKTIINKIDRSNKHTTSRYFNLSK